MGNVVRWARSGAVVSIVCVSAVAAIALAAAGMKARQDELASQCQSHHNQMVRAIIMYCNDNDDYLPPTNWHGLGTGSSWGQLSPDTERDVAWPQTTLPYMRNADVLVCPADPVQDHAIGPRTAVPVPSKLPWRREVCRAFHTNLGLNYNWLSYQTRSHSKRKWHIEQQSTVGSPAATVLFIDTVFDRDGKGRPLGGGAFVVDSPVPPPGAVILKPVGATPPWNGWECYTLGKGNMASAACKRPSAFGKAYPFHPEGEGFTVSFVDGHVKRMTAPELVAGWDLNKSEVPDWDAFLWDSYQ